MQLKMYNYQLADLIQTNHSSKKKVQNNLKSNNYTIIIIEKQGSYTQNSPQKSKTMKQEIGYKVLFFPFLPSNEIADKIIDFMNGCPNYRMTKLSAYILNNYTDDRSPCPPYICFRYHFEICNLFMIHILILYDIYKHFL